MQWQQHLGRISDGKKQKRQKSRFQETSTDRLTNTASYHLSCCLPLTKKGAGLQQQLSLLFFICGHATVHLAVSAVDWSVRPCMALLNYRYFF